MNTATAPLPIKSRSWRIPRLRTVLSIRFSLRELLLVTLVCAVSAAWLRGVLERNPDYRPTKIADYFTNQLPRDVAAIETALGEDGRDVLSQASKEPPFAMDKFGDANGGRSAHRHWWCKIRLPWSERDKFLNDLKGRIQSQLYVGRADEPIWNWEHVAEVSFTNPNSLGAFTRYHCGDVQGIIRFYVVRTGEGTAHLFATLDEQL
jgi:hypothetical protein